MRCETRRFGTVIVENKEPRDTEQSRLVVNTELVNSRRVYPMCFQDDAFWLLLEATLVVSQILKDNFYYIVAITREAVSVVRALAAFVVLCLLLVE